MRITQHFEPISTGYGEGIQLVKLEISENLQKKYPGDRGLGWYDPKHPYYEMSLDEAMKTDAFSEISDLFNYLEGKPELTQEELDDLDGTQSYFLFHILCTTAEEFAEYHENYSFDSDDSY